MGRFLDILDQLERQKKAGPALIAERSEYEKNEVNEKSRQSDGCAQHPGTDFFRLNRLFRTPPPFTEALEALERRCPDYVETDRWQQAVADARRFLAQWGEQAAGLGWTAQDLFGLHAPPDDPHPSYRRLARYDCTGLIWLLQGRQVIALAETTAAIAGVSAVTVFRKTPKPEGGT